MTEALIQHPSPGDLIPRPDPTALTATAVANAKDDLRRELASQKEILEARIGRIETGQRDNATNTRSETADMINSLEAILTQRIAGLEQIMKILDKVINSGPAERDALRERLQNDINIAVDNLKHLHEERFAAIAQQFTERDIRSEQDKKSSKDALDAALLAQKESVSQQNDANTTKADKTEASFTKQIDQVGNLITALDKSWQDRFTELKERIDRGEGQGQGAVTAHSEQRLTISQVIAALAVVAAVVTLILYATKR